MLTIRDAQLDTLAEDRERRLVVELKARVVEALPAVGNVLDPHTLDRAVREAVAQARAFDLVTDQEVGEFVGLVFVCGERFFEREEYSWADARLRSSEPGRVREVLERVQQQLAEKGGRAP
jgi:hypothetical protein